MFQILNDDFYNTTIELILRFGFNLLVNIIISKYIYYNITRKHNYMFTFILIGTTTFLISYLLVNVELQLGFALGLFAIFGIIRYRTTTINIKEMTYLFIIISTSVINALSNNRISYLEVVFANIAIILTTLFVERLKKDTDDIFITIRYEKINLVTPQHSLELIKDLEDRTGLIIKKVEIVSINYQYDTAEINIYFSKNQEELINNNFYFKSKE